MSPQQIEDNAVEASCQKDSPCPTCAANAEASQQPPSFVYAVGRIEARFPRLSVEKEFAQAGGRSETVALTDRQVLAKVLKERHNRYLVRQLCWILTIGNLENYILLPRDPADYELLIDALRPTPRPTDVDIVIGLKGPIAPPAMCNGLLVPVVIFDQIYSFDRESLVKSIPRPETTPAGDVEAAAEELLDRIIQMADNSGGTDDHRALNYLAVRYPAVYATVVEQNALDASLSAVDVQPSALSGVRKIMEVVFSFTNRNTGVVQKFAVRVDVTDEFPFLVTRLSPTYDR
jgi:hypothetical protein